MTRAAMLFVVAVAVSPGASAQTPAPCPCAPPPGPPPIWTGAASFGFGMTSGNSDTRNLNTGLDLKRDARQKHVITANALYLWASDSEDETANRLAFRARDAYKISTRTFIFGEGGYLRDPFQAIDFLFALTGGAGYKFVDTDTTKFSLDGGAGVTWEDNPGLDTRTYGAITGGQDFAYTLSQTTSIIQGFHALWKADDFGDALYTFKIGVAAAMTTRTALKVDLLDTFKSKPPSDEFEENDIALILALAYKF